MKIKHVLLVLLLAFCAPWSAKGQGLIYPSPLTINNGPGYFSSAPFKADCLMYGTHSQFIIPQSVLTDLRGGTVTKLSFYCTKSNANFGTATFSIYMAEVPYNVFSNMEFDWDSMTEVYTGTLSVNNSGIMEINLDSDFTYYGDNLMIGFKEVGLGNKTVSNLSWIGTRYPNYVTLVSYCSNPYVSTPSYSYSNFLPKMTMAYYVLDFPTVEVTVGEIGSNAAVFSWEAPSADVTGYKYQCHKASETYVDSWEELPSTATSLTIEGLDPNTDHVFRIKACYGEHESTMTVVDFKTTCPDYVTIPFYENFDAYEVADVMKPGFRTLPDCWEYINTSTNLLDIVFPTMHYSSTFP